MKNNYLIYLTGLMCMIIMGASDTVAQVNLSVDGTIQSKASFPRYEFVNTSNVTQGWIGAGGGDMEIVSYAGNLNFYATSGGIPTLQMALATNGNFGIGTATPTEKLHVKGGDALIDDGDFLLYDAGIYMLDGGTEEIRILNQGGDLSINTVGPASDYQLYIEDNDGFVGINNNNPQSQLHIKQLTNFSGIRLENNLSTNNWNMYVDNVSDYNFAYNDILKSYISDTDGSYNEFSDRRLKNSIERLPGVLDDIMRLRPASYYYNTDTEKTQRSIGFVAQEVEEVFPHLVRHKGEMKSLVYDDFAILSIKAIQEQQDIITQQAVLIAQLNDRLTQLENK